MKDKICWWCGYIICKGVKTATMWVSEDKKNTKHIEVTLHQSCYIKAEREI